jgi:hypothetical protein
VKTLLAPELSLGHRKHPKDTNVLLTLTLQLYAKLTMRSALQNLKQKLSPKCCTFCRTFPFLSHGLRLNLTKFFHVLKLCDIKEDMSYLEKAPKMMRFT